MRQIIISVLILLSLLSAGVKKQPALLRNVSKQQLQVLSREKIEIDRESSRFSQGEIAVYLTEEEFEKLSVAGYQLQWNPDTRTKSERERGYYTYETLGSALLNLEQTYPEHCKRFSLGQSVQGREMWAVKISDNVLTDEAEPEFLYSSTMHGDEVTGMEMLMKLAAELLAGNQAGRDTASFLVNNTQIYLIPDYNPDGTAAGERYNANWVDLNRDFPEMANNDPNTTAGREIETANMMNWLKNRHIVLGANFHGGAEVINYPFDAGTSQVYSTAPDDIHFRWLSRSYVDRNTSLNVYNSEYNPGYGITNGAAWYAIDGGMQDWCYNYHNQLHVTVEISNVKWPDYSQIPEYWQRNRDAMYWYLLAVHKGVKGVVTDQISGAPLAATVRVAGIDKNYYTNPANGDFYRILQPGTYSLTFSAEGYQSRTLENITVTDNGDLIGTATELDVKLGGTAISDDNLPAGYVLEQNYPNPFNPQTRINYELRVADHVRLAIYNSSGELVKTLFDGMQSAGQHSVNVDGSKLNSGVYFYRLEVAGKSAERRMLFIK